MKALFLSQSKSIEMFYDLGLTLKRLGKLTAMGLYVADSSFYKNLTNQRPEIAKTQFLLKEWEILQKARQSPLDLERLKVLEKQYGDPTLWNALVSDRRIYLGPLSQLTQDYKSRYTHEEMLKILIVTFDEFEKLFNTLNPDFVCNFISVTIGEYVASLIAKARGIPFMNLRPTRIKNYFHAASDIHEPSEIQAKAYQNILKGHLSTTDIDDEISSILDQVRKNSALYEGVIPANKKVKASLSAKKQEQKGFFKKVSGLLKRQLTHVNYEKDDNHFIPPVKETLFRRVIKPKRLKKIETKLQDRFIEEDQLKDYDYVFYPLHKEPEVTLLVYSPFYMNQIEVIRNIARSIPAHYKLIVKEHPASIGYRDISYYEKILEIPNVLLIRPQVDSRKIVIHSKLVCVISGSIGLEALLIKKPALSLGNVPFSLLPRQMFIQNRDISELAVDIHSLLENHVHHEEALRAYVGAVLKTSVSVDFYSRLLGRAGVFGATNALSDIQTRQEHLEKLGDYLITQLDREPLYRSSNQSTLDKKITNL